MIGLIQNKTNYEYDIRSLILAFMIDEKIELTEDTASSIYDFILKVQFAESQTSISIYENGIILEEKTVPGDYKDKTYFKNQFKIGLYQVLSKYSNKKLPWGTLTGIRPTKLIMKELHQGQQKEQIVPKLKEKYLISDEKLHLSLDVVEREEALMKSIDVEQGYSLYIGIPFCPTTCLYCSFTSYPIKQYENIIQDYLNAVVKEIAFVSQEYKNRKLISLYIGGGTPTTLTANQMKWLFEQLQHYFDFSNVVEITVEAGRPDSITKEKLRVLYDAGVHRISINPQTMNDKTLKVIGRGHSVEQVLKSFYEAREVGIDNINMDTICGLPGESMKEIRHTYEEIFKLNPESLTVHSLALKRTSKLRQLKEEYSFGATREMISYAHEMAYEMGMNPYYLYRQKNIPGNFENVGFSKEGKECYYNILIMEELHDIIAVGAGASSKIKGAKGQEIYRVENLKDIHQYIDRIDEMIIRKKNALERR
ncbi:MAG: coproporphyrinogen dehydrogenase HemZ [Anaerostipes sp.]|nr:coproporphyrinogen dehydrogenase HemZ [Anaerostipes sp.]